MRYHYPLSVFIYHLFLSLQMYRKHDHPRLYLIKYAGEFQVGITGMDIPHPITDLDLGREDKTGEIKIEANTKLRTPIVFFDLHEVLRFFGTGITGHIDIGFDT